MFPISSNEASIFKLLKYNYIRINLKNVEICECEFKFEITTKNNFTKRE